MDVSNSFQRETQSRARGPLTVSEVDHTVTHIGIEDIVGNRIPHNITIIDVKSNLESRLGAPPEFLLACTRAV